MIIDKSGNFYFSPKWYSLAKKKKVLELSNAIYTEIKQYLHEEPINKEKVKAEDCVLFIIVSLKLFFEWSDGEIADLCTKFKELISGYDIVIRVDFLLPAMKEIVIRIERDNNPPYNKLNYVEKAIGDSDYICRKLNVPNHQSEETVNKNIEKKHSNFEIVKDFMNILFKIIIYWLAIFGFLTLLGV